MILLGTVMRLVHFWKAYSLESWCSHRFSQSVFSHVQYCYSTLWKGFENATSFLLLTVGAKDTFVSVLQDSSPLRWSLVLRSTRPAFSGVRTAVNGARASSTTTCLTGICTWAWPSPWRVWPSSSTPPRGTAYAGTTRSTSRDTRATRHKPSFTRL